MRRRGLLFFSSNSGCVSIDGHSTENQSFDDFESAETFLAILKTNQILLILFEYEKINKKEINRKHQNKYGSIPRSKSCLDQAVVHRIPFDCLPFAFSISLILANKSIIKHKHFDC